MAALWPFNDATSGAAYRDIGPHGFRAIQNGGTLNTPKFLSNAAGTCVRLANNGYSLNGSITQTLGMGVGKWALGGFIKTSDPAPGNTLLVSTYDGSAAQTTNIYNLGGHIAMYIRDAAAANTGLLSGPLIDDNVPHFWLMNYDATAKTYSFWLDGVQYTSGTLPSGALLTSGGQMHHFSLSGGGLSQAYTGDAADFFIMNDNLNASQQAAIMFYAGLASFPPFIPPTPVVAPGLPTVPPAGFTCSSIADVCAALTQLEFKIDSLRSTIPYQTAPSLAFGTPITGVTGSGNLSPAGLLGLEVTLTTIPPSWGRTSDTPHLYEPPVGYLLLDYGGAGPYTRELPINRTPQLELFDVRNVVEVHYTFRPGIVATLTPVDRGP